MMTGFKKKILILGADGFIGKKICDNLAKYDLSIIAATRLKPYHKNKKINYIVTGDYLEFKSWPEVISGCYAIVFAAGIAHSKKKSKDSDFLNKMNTNLPIKIAIIAKELFVKKFIFFSSIKVNGEHTKPGKPFNINSDCNPWDAYGSSKLNAEKHLLPLISKQFQISIIRLPLVIGKNAKGNIGLLQKLIKFKIPMPFANLNSNSKSIIFLSEVCYIINDMIFFKDNINGVHFVCHKKNFSTKDLIILIGNLENKKPILFPIPPYILNFFFNLLNLKRLKHQLLSDLEIQSNYKVEISQFC